MLTHEVQIRERKIMNQGSEDLLEIKMTKIRNYLNYMKNNKLPGKDNIVIETVKIGGEKLLEKNCTFIQCVYATQLHLTVGIMAL